MARRALLIQPPCGNLGHTPLSADPGLNGIGSWLQGQGVSLVFTTYRANRLIFLGTAEPAGEPAEPASGSADPNQPTGAGGQLHHRRCERP